MMPLLFVVNPKSGQLDLDQVTGTIERVMREAQRDYEIRLPGKNGALAPVAQQAVADASARSGAVIAVGGDGTMNTVAQFAVESGCPFGLLPQGTFNYFSRTHRIDLDPEAGLRALLDARLEPVQVGVVNGHVFLVNASVGLYSAVLQDRETYKKQWGRYRLVAMLAALMTILRHESRLKIRIATPQEAREIRTPMLFICNNALQLERLGLPHAEALQQNRFAAITLKPVGRWTLLWLLLRGAIGKLGDADHVFTGAFSELTVHTRKPRRIRVATDGEVTTMTTPLEFSVSGKPLLLMCPRDRTGAENQSGQSKMNDDALPSRAREESAG